MYADSTGAACYTPLTAQSKRRFDAASLIELAAYFGI